MNTVKCEFQRPVLQAPNCFDFRDQNSVPCSFCSEIIYKLQNLDFTLLQPELSIKYVTGLNDNKCGDVASFNVIYTALHTIMLFIKITI